MLVLQKLSKKYGGKFALRGIDLEVASGQFCVLLGPNGAGKSTLLRILCTLTRATGGDAKINDFNIKDEQIDVRRSIGVALHETLLYDDLTACENLRFYYKLQGIQPKEQLIDEMLKSIGLLHRKNDRVGNFSRGMKQRLSVARALIGNPKVLLLDEPFSGLDVKAREQVSSMLKIAVSKGAVVLMTAHDPDMGHDLGERLLVLVDGKLVYDKQKTAVTKEGFIEDYRKLVGVAK